jgi:hypothetical protein
LVGQQLHLWLVHLLPNVLQRFIKQKKLGNKFFRSFQIDFNIKKSKRKVFPLLVYVQRQINIIVYFCFCMFRVYLFVCFFCIPTFLFQTWISGKERRKKKKSKNVMCDSISDESRWKRDFFVC